MVGNLGVAKLSFVASGLIYSLFINLLRPLPRDSTVYITPFRVVVWGAIKSHG